MKYIYKINSHVNGGVALAFDIEADSYALHTGGFFDFYQGFGQNRELIATVDATKVFDIQRTENNAK
ncbi:hypothetical protein DEI81_08010 [Curtobacterium sp. MCBD17_013]|uniref:hypothetical protein n=1 Tax=Curtobacterium sp. MCBD17_013 TaxID=2175668 RepID=UPI000DA6E431|nr:hypothetical protein [Curtobacterium sp. MCBD17_013]PZF63342.1 hypothetical protein DEI81_08010 [Curtobacterium sp. MCBD17_013]